MRVLLFGIYGLGERALAALAVRQVPVVGVVTKPDQGPGQRDLLARASRMGLPLHQPQALDDPGFLDAVAALQPELVAVAGFHLKLPRSLLRLPRLGAVNTHLSLLPQYRGPCPWKWAIIRGERTTGVTIHVMTPRFDRGEILAQRRIALEDHETGESLFQRLAAEGAELLGETVKRLAQGGVTGIRQDEAFASYHGAPTEDDACIRWAQGAREIRNLIRGLHPRPGAWTTHHGIRYGVAGGSIVETSGNLRPAGIIVDRDRDSVTAATGSGFLRLEGLVARDTGAPARPEDFPLGSVLGEN